MRAIALILFLATSLHLFGQNRIPFNGENIQFYPLNKNNIASSEGYDCFYDKDLVVKNGKYSFKPKYRFNRNKNNTTSSDNIEGYTFNVLNYEILNDNTEKEILLLFLRRNEDNKEIIMRVPWNTDKKSNKITQSFRRYKRKDPYSLTNTTSYVYLNLPFVNADSIASIKQQFEDTIVVFKRVYSKEYENRTKDFDIIVKDINEGKTLESHKAYKCTDIVFRNVYESDIYDQLCASVTDETGKTFTIPVAYFVGNNNMTDPNNGSAFYFFNLLFKEKNEYLFNTYRNFGCEHIVNKYSGKRVYYGLKELYNYDDSYYSENVDENRILGEHSEYKSLYRLTEGFYECLFFDVLKRHQDYIDPIPFAILKDENGTIFKVPACRTSIKHWNNKNNYCGSFDKYFVLEEEADKIRQAILAEKQREEVLRKKKQQEQVVLRKKKLQELTTKYGETYAQFLIEKSDKAIARFEVLSQKYGKKSAKLILEGKVSIGWSKEMCRESWGKPERINKTTTAWGVHEQWVYGYNYLYFEKGILTTIQN